MTRGEEIAIMLKNIVTYADLDWTMFRVWNTEDREQFDQYLVNINHPLAWRAGTWEDRMRAYHEQAHAIRAAKGESK